MGYADFCVSPTSNILSTVDASDNTIQSLTYYSSCVGTNPVDLYIYEAYNATADLSLAIEVLTTNSALCPNDPYILDMNRQVVSINRTLDDIVYVTSCVPIQDEWNTLLEDSICSGIFTGYFTVWLALYTTLVLLYFVCIFTSILYQYFYLTDEEKELSHLGYEYMPSEVGLNSMVSDSSFSNNSNAGHAFKDNYGIDHIIRMNYENKYSDPVKL